MKLDGIEINKQSPQNKTIIKNTNFVKRPEVHNNKQIKLTNHE